MGARVNAWCRRIAAAVLLGTASCSTIELAYDVPCQRGEEAATLRVWVVPDWSCSDWGSYMLIGDFLVPIIDPFISGYWAVADLSNDYVRTRGGPWLAPFVKLAAIVLPCASAARERLDLDRALFGLQMWTRTGEMAVSELPRPLVLSANVTLDEAKVQLVRALTNDPEAIEGGLARIVEVEWLPPLAVRTMPLEPVKRLPANERIFSDR